MISAQDYQRSILYTFASPTRKFAAWITDDLIAYSSTPATLAFWSVAAGENKSQIDFPQPFLSLTAGPGRGTVTCNLGDQIIVISIHPAMAAESLGFEVRTVGGPQVLSWSFVYSSSQCDDIVAIDEKLNFYRWSAALSWNGPQPLRSVHVTSACMLNAGTTVCGTAEGDILLLNGDRPPAIVSAERAHGDQVMSLYAISPEKFISCSRDGSVAKWSVAENQATEIWRKAFSNRHFINCITVRGDTAAIGTAAGIIILLDAATGKFQREASVHTDSIRALSFNPGSGPLLSAGDDGAVKVTNGESLVSQQLIQPALPYLRAADAASRDGDLYVVCGGTDGSVSILGLRSKRLTVGLGSPQVRSLRVTPDSHVLVGREDGTIQSLTFPSLEQEWTVEVPGAVYSIAVTAGEGHIYAGTRTGHLVRLKNDGTMEWTEKRHMSILGDVKVSGNSLITCSDDRSMRISHLTANTRVSEFSYEGLALNNILQHTSGDIYLSSDDGKVIRVLPSGRTVDVYDYHRSPVRALAEARDGLVASGDRSGEVLVWPPDRFGPVRRVQLGRRVIALADARPFGDLLAVTENEVSIIDLPPSSAACSGADGRASSASRSAPSLLAGTSGPKLGTVIHLSDLHFHGGEPADSWLSPLLEDLERELSVRRVDLLIVSGDVSSVAAEGEYAAAAKFLAELRSALGSPPILLTPGNHDLSWAASKRAYVPKRRADLTPTDLQQAMIEASPDYVEIAQPDDLKTRFQAFADFYLEVTSHAYSLNPEKQVSSVALPALRIAVWGLNSSWQIDHHYTSRASINRSALARVLGEARELDARGQGWTKMIVWHHPTSLPGEENIANPEVLEQLSKAGFRVLLHGHIHKPSRDLYQYDVTGDRGIATVGTGTFGALTREWTPGFPLGYNCIDVHQVSLVVRSRKRESPDGAWTADARWRTGPQRDPVSWFFIDRLYRCPPGGRKQGM